MIGAIGSKAIDDVIIFEVSDQKVLTFVDFTRKNTVRFAKNDILLKKPIRQYVGSDIDKISFKIILKAQFGVNPQKEMDKLIKLHRDGAVLSIIIGNSVFGTYRWTIAELGMPWNEIDNKGFCISSTCDISFEEYV